MVHVVEAEEGEVYDIELEEKLLWANQKLAEDNARLFRKHGVRSIDVMGAIGSGKTSLIKVLISKLKNKYRIAALDGDVTTTIDADLIAEEGVPVVQITTAKECHLDANLVRKGISKIDISATDLLFIENVGNLICPAEFPLGSSKRIVVVSISEGPYMIKKHPLMFTGADIVVLNKTDLEAAMGVKAVDLVADVRAINPRAVAIPVSCRNGEGIDEVIFALKL